MSRINNELRKVFLRLYKQGKTPIEVATSIGVTRQTITNWIRLLSSKGEEFFFETRYNSKKSKLDLVKLREVFKDNPTKFNWEIAKQFYCSYNLIRYFRKKWGLTNKKARTTYKESDPALKKTFKKD